MTYQALLARARDLVDEMLSDLAADRPTSEIVGWLEAISPPELLRARALIDQRLAASARPLPIEVVDGGLRFGDWLADELDLDYDRTHRLVGFIDEYGVVADQLGHEPTISCLAASTGLSIATVNRRLADFRAAFPSEQNPARLARALRNALDDLRLWGTVEDSLNARIGDVPVIGSSASRDLAHVVAALEQAAQAMGGTAVGSASLFKFMVERGMEVPKDAGALATTLRVAWKAGLIMRAPNGVYTPLDGTGKTEWDRPLSDYYVAAQYGFPLPNSWPSTGGH